jgi:septal ring factor EnvC (AmiA/AmiB activator)
MERKLLENEIIIKRYKEEMTSIHQLWLEQETMINKLDQPKLEEELDILVSEAKKYEEDVTDMKKKLSNCEGDIAECRQKIAKLMDKLEDREKNAKIEEIERLEKEENDRLLAEQLKTAIREKNREYEAQVKLYISFIY